MHVKDASIETAIREAIDSSRKERKKLIALIKRNKPEIGESKIRRVYQLKGFALMKRLKQRSRNNPRNPATVPFQPNIEWAIDFMHDALAEGRKIRNLNIIDPYIRQCKGIYIRNSIHAQLLIHLLEQSIEGYGKPKFLRSDNGPEFISKQFRLWLRNNGIG
jgi:putative transposase